jgi:hypothetical protein
LKKHQETKKDSNLPTIQQKSRFIDFVKNPSMVSLIEYLPLISFIISNFFILKIFDHFFCLNQFTIFSLPSNFTFWIYFLIGLILSMLIIKTNFVIRIKNGIGDFIAFFGELGSFFRRITKKKKLHSWKLTDIFLMSIRNLFFNVLNDLFILTIFWVSFFCILFFFGKLPLPTDFDFSPFFEAIGAIGILSGFFQIYTDSFKKQTTELIQSFTKKQLKILEEVSMDDFLAFLGQKGKREDAEKIANKIVNTDKVLSEVMSYPGFRNTPITVYNLPSLGYSSSMSMFQILDVYVSAFPSEISKEQLNKYYDEYFSAKLKQYRDESKSSDIAEMQKLIFSTIVFSDEVLSSLTKVDIDFPEDDKVPENFIEFYKKFSFSCINVLLDKLMNFDNEPPGKPE